MNRRHLAGAVYLAAQLLPHAAFGADEPSLAPARVLLRSGEVVRGKVAGRVVLSKTQKTDERYMTVSALVDGAGIGSISANGTTIETEVTLLITVATTAAETQANDVAGLLNQADFLADLASSPFSMVTKKSTKDVFEGTVIKENGRAVNRSVVMAGFHASWDTLTVIKGRGRPTEQEPGLLHATLLGTYREPGPSQPAGVDPVIRIVTSDGERTLTLAELCLSPDGSCATSSASP